MDCFTETGRCQIALWPAVPAARGGEAKGIADENERTYPDPDLMDYPGMGVNISSSLELGGGGCSSRGTGGGCGGS